MLPESVLHHVVRTPESVILDDAATQSPFSADPYIIQNRPRSILCLPLINQTELTGVLYLENRLAAGVFAPTRIAVLKLLASQAAIALENTHLYRDLAQREARIRRLVDANIVGIFIWDFDGRILEANDAFLHIVAYDREDLAAGRIKWTDLTPPEWHDLDARLIEENKMIGRLPPFEKEYFRKDGSRVPVLIGVATLEESRDHGVAFVLELTDRKRAEAEARESERRLADLRMEMARVNRIAMLGQFAGSIAHEVNQPNAAAHNNANAALNFLNREPSDLEEVREALCCIVNDTDRAGDIIDGIRRQIQKTLPRNDRFDINDAIKEVITSTANEVANNGVSVQTSLDQDLPPVEADRVQLQQVVLNLILNALEAMSSISNRARKLVISTEQSGAGGVVVSVRDSGPGIDADKLERIFDSFYTTKPNGVGMGLSICRSIIEAHGGRLWASPNVPSGATFQFTLPGPVAASGMPQEHD